MYETPVGDGTLISHATADRPLIESRKPCRCVALLTAETQTAGDDILPGFIELHALTWAHQLVELGIHLTKAPLEINAITEKFKKKRHFQITANSIRYGPIGLQRLLFCSVYRDCRSAKKAE